MMPTYGITVAQEFEEFNDRLTRSATEAAALKAHRASIEQCLGRNFNLIRFFRSGSFGNGTSIRNFSDVDYFAWLDRENTSDDSKRTLQKVANALEAQFPRTGVYVKEPAVIVPFGVEISPTRRKYRLGSTIRLHMECTCMTFRTSVAD
jgi:tRNA nucleotidyltransferase (CCA-adding enzyme)